MTDSSEAIPASLLPDPDLMFFLARRADDERDPFPDRAAAIEAILWSHARDVSRWRESLRLGNPDTQSFWAGSVSSNKTTINYLAMAYRSHPEFPEHCREWMFPDVMEGEE